MNSNTIMETNTQIDYEVAHIELETAADELADARKILDPSKLQKAKSKLVHAAREFVAAENKHKRENLA